MIDGVLHEAAPHVREGGACTEEACTKAYNEPRELDD